MAKVIPFRPKKRTIERATLSKRRLRRPTSATWWIIVIIALCLLLPYILPFTR
ncbi:MAG: hypothetical protein OWU33_02145 [Firmicutes bacterium]|nr:hypothetical protein [Bacillota bacterium]